MQLEVVQSLDLYLHVAKHAPEFESVDSYNHTMSNIPEIISEPLFVYYDSSRSWKKSILQFTVSIAPLFEKTDIGAQWEKNE